MAFPTTSVIDTFNRADASPATGWTTTAIFSGDQQVKTLTNTLTDVSASLWCSSIYSSTGTTFGADSEAYYTISANGAPIEVFIRIQNPATGSVNNYFAHMDCPTNSLQLWKTVANAQTQLGSSVATTEANGDSVGVEAVGTSIGAYFKTAAGSWVSKIAQTDSAVSGVGCIGIAMQDSSAKIDDFGGGTVVSGSFTAKFRKTLSGLGTGVGRRQAFA